MAKATPEGKVKAEVKRILTEYGAYYAMPVQNGMGSPMLDFHCHYYGLAFLIETKAPGKKPTPRQAKTIEKAEKAGGKCFVIDGPAGYSALSKWLNEVKVDATGSCGDDQTGTDSEDHCGELELSG